MAPSGADPLGGGFDPAQFEQMLKALEGLEGLQMPQEGAPN